MNITVSIKFHVHTRDHTKINENLEELSETEVECIQTDLGYTGHISGTEVDKSALLNICDDFSEVIVSVLIVTLDENGLAEGEGFNYTDGSRSLERYSRGNTPQSWNGIVYDGMHLDGEGLKNPNE